MFYRVGENLNLQRWQEVVKGETEFSIPKEFELDTERFLYFTARAITADTVNTNGDRFPAEEVAKAYKTFIGKGIYYNHNEDTADKSFGIILDARWYPEHKYVDIFAAIDKNRIKELYPGLLERLENGQLNSGSMSAIARRARCSVCGNVATNQLELCVHSNPNSPFYVKGKKLDNGQYAYDDNYDLTFLGWSLVENPAFYESRIFTIYSSEDTKLENLRNEFKRYCEIMQKFDINDFNIRAVDLNTETVNKIIETEFERKILNKVRQLIEEEVRKDIDPILQEIENKYKDLIDRLVNEKFSKVTETMKIESKASIVKKIPKTPKIRKFSWVEARNKKEENHG